MASFEVFNDAENHVVGVPLKLKGDVSKSIVPRSALGDIDRNKFVEGQPAGKSFKSKIPVLHERDVSEAFKDVKLDSVEEVKVVEKPVLREHVTVEEDKLENNEEQISDISFDVSPSEVDPKFSYASRLRAHTEPLYDCHTYRDDIYQYLRQLELKFKPKPFYMKKQPDITYMMRSILVDWMVEVAEEYKLQGETLFMAVSYVDRFLSIMAVARGKLQLLGTAALFVAAKYEEIYPPEVGEFTYITDDTYTKKQLLRMEHLILKTLNFDISAPTHHTFITHLTKVADIDDKISTLALYICELGLLESDPYLSFAPSLVTSASLALAHHCLNRTDVWPSELRRVSGYTLSQLAPVLSHLNSTHSKAPSIQQTSIREKYKSNKRDGVSLVPHKPLIVRDPSSTPETSTPSF